MVYLQSKRLTDHLPIDLPRLLSELEQRDVDDVVVGGIAALLQGASRPTADVDILIDSSAANIECFLIVCKELRMRNRTGNEKLDRQLAERAAERQWYVSDVQDIFWSAQSDAGQSMCCRRWRWRTAECPMKRWRKALTKFSSRQSQRCG